MFNIRSFVVSDSNSSDGTEVHEENIDSDNPLELITDDVVLKAELKKIKKKLRKAEDLLNEVRSTHESLKKELKKRKKKKKKAKEIMDQETPNP
jgi:hypothetical protein